MEEEEEEESREDGMFGRAGRSESWHLSRRGRERNRTRTQAEGLTQGGSSTSGTAACVTAECIMSRAA